MCGLCGWVSTERDVVSPSDQATLLAMRDTMVPRGPDDAGTHFGQGVALGSRRLAVLDLSPHGHMPMATPDGRHRIVYNGEIYNFHDLKRNLESRGYVFTSHSDTEVVLYGLVEYGTSFLDQMNGMFALALWDEDERSLLLARDRLGIKPLFYAQLGSRLLFASEPKALFTAGIRRQMNIETWEELLCFRYVAGEHTPFANIHRLLPGHHLRWRNGSLKTTRWWNLSERARELRSCTPRNAEDWYRSLFDESINLQRIADVPVGVMLSGGLDSGTVAASLAMQASGGVNSFTVSFSERGYDEAPLARMVAARWGLIPHELVIPQSGVATGVREALRLLDEPLAHTNEAHILSLARLAKREVTVLLSGEGADETLNGYVRYQPLRFARSLSAASTFARWVPPRLVPAGRARKLLRFLHLDSTESRVMYNACDLLPHELAAYGYTARAHHPYRAQILQEAQTLYPGDALRQSMYYDQHTFLQSLLDRNDRMTMGASIECRVPFLDHRLVEGLAALPTHALLGNGRRKAILRTSLGNRLPLEVQRARKWGFGVPWSAYLRREPELVDIVRTLADREPIMSGPLSRDVIRKLGKTFLAGQGEHDVLVKELVLLALWHEEVFAHPPLP